MARFDKGWVKLYRKAVLGDIGSNYIRSGLFQTLVVIANIQESKVSWAGKPLELKRGQIATSYSELASLGEVDRKTVAKHLGYLQLRGTITVEVCSVGIIVTINNYEEYQGQDAEWSQPSPSDMDRGMDNDVPHIKERKKERERESSHPTQVLYESPRELRAAVPIQTWEIWKRSYPDEAWLEKELVRAFDHHVLDPAQTPRTKGKWLQKLDTWFSIGWESRRNLKAVPKTGGWNDGL